MLEGEIAREGEFARKGEGEVAREIRIRSNAGVCDHAGDSNQDSNFLECRMIRIRSKQEEKNERKLFFDIILNESIVLCRCSAALDLLMGEPRRRRGCDDRRRRNRKIRLRVNELARSLQT